MTQYYRSWTLTHKVGESLVFCVRVWIIRKTRDARCLVEVNK